jgi:hypothetical protein
VSPDKRFYSLVKASEHSSEDIVEIRTNSNSLVARLSMESPSGERGRYVLYSKWTPDSKYFVFSTMSSGLHSVWHRPTFAYSVKTNGFYRLDDFCGSIVEVAFSTKYPDIVTVTIGNHGLDKPYKKDMKLSDVCTGNARTITNAVILHGV